MFKCIVAGSRSFNRYYLMKEKLDNIFANIKDNIEIVSGGSYGADKLGEQYAAERGYLIRRFPADWSMGSIAGPLRNEEMAKYVGPDSGCVVFWNGISKGSKNMIDIAKRYKLKLRIINTLQK